MVASQAQFDAGSADSDPIVGTFGHSSILVVDDSATVRKMIVHYLRRSGFGTITEVTNGVEAIAEIEKRVPDLVITDISMPIMNGLELIRRLRRDARWAAIPVLVETGSTAHEDRGEIFAAGATDLISKPINPREMLGRIKVHLEQQHLVRKLREYQNSMAQDLNLARDMQEALMPGTAEVRAIEAAFELDIATSYRASAGLGGDLWSLYPVRDNELVLWMVDFAGHGIAAALNTFRFHSLVRSAQQADLPLALAMEALNSQLAGVLPVGQFATVLGARFLFGENCVEVVSAGAPPLVLRSGAAGRFQALEAPGYPVGLIQGATFSAVRYPFPPGSALLAYSDALVETPPEPNCRFCPHGLAEMLDKLGPTMPAADIRSRLERGLFPHQPEDDLTILMIRDCREG